MAKQNYSKPALTYIAQLEQLKARGLYVEDEEKALHLLESISYYRLSGYWYPFLFDKEKHFFKSGSSFSMAFSLYKFDRELRILMLGELEKIEVAIRAKMIYIFSQARGPFWFEDPANFTNKEKHCKTLEKIKLELSRSDEQFINSFRRRYSNPYPPSWITMEIASFGVLSSLFSNFAPGKDKRSVANYFGVSDTVLASWLHSITYIRNVCAHHARIWNREMRIRPIEPKTTSTVWLSDTNIPKNRLFYILSLVVYLMNTINPGHSIQTKINVLLSRYPMIDTRAMGFPDNWETEALWNV